jgi:hypothetical protein
MYGSKESVNEEELNAQDAVFSAILHMLDSFFQIMLPNFL